MIASNIQVTASWARHVQTSPRMAPRRVPCSTGVRSHLPWTTYMREVQGKSRWRTVSNFTVIYVFTVKLSFVQNRDRNSCSCSACHPHVISLILSSTRDSDTSMTCHCAVAQMLGNDSDFPSRSCSMWAFQVVWKYWNTRTSTYWISQGFHPTANGTAEELSRGLLHVWNNRG